MFWKYSPHMLIFPQIPRVVIIEYINSVICYYSIYRQFKHQNKYQKIKFRFLYTRNLRAYIVISLLLTCLLFRLSMMMTKVETGWLNIFVTHNLHVYLMYYNVFYPRYLRVQDIFSSYWKINLEVRPFEKSCIIILHVQLTFKTNNLTTISQLKSGRT